MADWTDKAMDKLVRDTDKQFTPLPPRKMYGRMYENVPRESLDYKSGHYSGLYSPNNDEGRDTGTPQDDDPNRHYHVYELDADGNVISPNVRYWRMKQFHGS